MLKILFDHQTFSLQRYGGISRYFTNIDHALKKEKDVISDISLPYSNNYYLQDNHGILGKTLGPLLLRKQKKIIKWNRRYSKYIIDHKDFDVLHPTYYDPYFLPGLSKPFVITVHDMIHEKFPQYFSPADETPSQKRRCIESASHIIAISESTKTDIQYYYNIPDNKISVIHHGFDNFIHDEEQIPSEPEQYLLYVGDRNAYKNFACFLSAIVPLLQKQPYLKVICAGGGEFQCAERELIERLDIHHRVSQKKVTDSEMATLYKNAKAFIYPSIYEGFGLPLLEAFKYQCPVIASDTKCFREIGGDAIRYFNPYDSKDICKVIESTIDNQEIKSHLIQNGHQQLQKFTMNNCMQQTIQVYKNIVSKS